jgi:glycerate kinase
VVAAARRARKARIPAIALVGQKTAAAHELHAEGLTAAFAILDGPMSLDAALTNAPRLLADLAEQIVRSIVAFL